MKAMLRHVKNGELEYDCLAFVCPGCVAMHDGDGLHMLPVNTDQKSPSWDWDGNLEKPTINPSILTSYNVQDNPRTCHSFLREGIFEFLSDCTHPLAGQFVELPDLPDWFINDSNGD